MSYSRLLCSHVSVKFQVSKLRSMLSLASFRRAHNLFFISSV